MHSTATVALDAASSLLRQSQSHDLDIDLAGFSLVATGPVGISDLLLLSYIHFFHLLRPPPSTQYALFFFFTSSVNQPVLRAHAYQSIPLYPTY